MFNKIVIGGLSLVLFLLFLNPKLFSRDVESLAGTEILAFYSQLKNLELDNMKMAQVENLILKRDTALLHLRKGELYLSKPVLGKVTGAVFIGEGTFKFIPPTEIEGYQLEKFTDSRELHLKFEELYLRFTDSTDKELEKLTFVTRDLPGNAKDIHSEGAKRQNKILEFNLNRRIISDLVDREEEGLFYADIKPETGKRLFFLYNPKEIEEVCLMQEFDMGLSPFLPKWVDLVCSFDKETDYLQGSSFSTEEKDEIRIRHYKIDASISSSGNLDATCEADLSFLKTGLRILDFYMAEKLKITSIRDEQGKELTFIQDEDFHKDKGFSEVAVVLEKPSVMNENVKLSFTYSGDALDRNDYGDFYVKTLTFWYPHYVFRQKATFDLSFKTPAKFEFVTIGRKVEERKEGNTLYTHWIEDMPVKYASFNMGNYKVKSFQNEGIPEIIVYHNEKEDIWYRTANPMENIGKDVANSLDFFQNIYGKCPFPSISVAEMPAIGGQGSPGLLHLTFITYLIEKEGSTESFRAHEVSHQWWGHTVGWKTYHDQWLCEGFAEYSGALYAQIYLKDNKKFFEMLENWQYDISGKIKYGVAGIGSKGSKAGPLWLGYRLSSSRSLDYDVLVYEKGAYVIHMLRNMLMDFNTMSDDRFIQMMKDFVQIYYLKEATTEDFKRVVDKHFGEDMSWFFNQWVYGIEIPTYIVSWDKEKTEDGKFVVNLKVKQENVSEDFKMIVPVVMDFGDGKYAVIKVLIDKPNTEVQLPKAPIEPKKIVFNPYYSVLCEVKYK